MLLVSEALLLMLFHGCPLEVSDRLAKGRWDAIGARSSSVRCQPWVAHDGVKVSTTGWIWDQHQSQQIPGLGGDEVGEGQGRVDNVSVQEVDVVSVGIGWVIVEWEISSQHGIEDNTATPDVDSGANVHAFANHKLWRGVAGAATGGLHQIVSLVLEAVGKSKICDNNVSMTVKEKVLEFEVTMDDFLLVNVPNARDELGEELCSISLTEMAVGENVIKKFTARSALEDDSDVLIGLDHVVETNNVRMLKGLAPR